MTRYSRGADFERRVKKDLQAHGWLAVRSAGSRSAIDLMAIAPGPEAILVQCKRDGKLPQDEKQALWDLSVAFNATSVLAYWCCNSIQYSEITADGYEDWVPE